MSKPKCNFCASLILAVLLSTTFTSCQQDRDTWGGAFVPDDEKLKIHEYTTSQFETWTDTVAITARTSISQANIGEIYDPIFGEKRTYILSQFLPNSLYWKYYEAGKVTFDSVFFGFRVDEIYQDEPLTLTFSQLKNAIELSDTAHKAAANKAFTTLASIEVTPKAKQLVRIPLDKEAWARTFLDEGKKHLTGYPDWLTYNHGFRIDARRKSPSPNKGAMLKFSLADQNTGIFFYWKVNDTTRSLRLGVLQRKLARFMGLERNLQGSTLASSLAKSHSEQDAEQRSYVEAAGDIRTVIDLTKVYEQWRDSLPTAVMRAELRIPLSTENAPLSDTLIKRLYTLVKNGDEYLASPDADRGKAVYDGYYSRQAKYYSLNLTYTIQALLTNQLPGNKIYLLGDTERFGYGRAVLGNGKASTMPMQLVISYTGH